MWLFCYFEFSFTRYVHRLTRKFGLTNRRASATVLQFRTYMQNNEAAELHLFPTNKKLAIIMHANLHWLHTIICIIKIIYMISISSNDIGCIKNAKGLLLLYVVIHVQLFVTHKMQEIEKPNWIFQSYYNYLKMNVRYWQFSNNIIYVTT